MPVMVGGAFVGRGGELGEIATLLALDTDDQPLSVVLAGDAGVGKTRLLRELRDRAVVSGWRVVVGHCLDFGDQALPYLPFSEILGRLAADLPDEVAETISQWPVLERLRAGRRMLGGSDEARDGTVERSEVLDAVHALLDRCAETPLLVVVEDAHWADSSTRELLTLLFARPFRNRVAVVASYRSDDLHRRHPLRPIVAQWSRMSSVRRLELDPLAPPAVRELIGSLHPEPLAAQAVSSIVDRAEGNAFFVEELVRVADDPGALPGNLSDLLMVRVDGLSDEAVAVLRVVAAVGRRSSHDLLEATAGLSPAVLEGALREAMERHVLVPRGQGYAFHHALLAEAVYEDLLPSERSRLHATLVEVFQSGAVTGTAAELARHAVAAGDRQTAVRAAVAAGNDALGLGAPTEAAQHYEQALMLLEDPRLRSEVDVDAVEVGINAAAAHVAAGNFSRAIRLGTELLEHTPSDAGYDRGRLLRSLANTVTVSDSNLDPLDLTSEAIGLIPDEVSEERARVLHAHARSLAISRRGEEAREFALEALDQSQRLGLPRMTSDIETTLAVLSDSAGEFVGRLVEVADRARAAGAVPAELRALALLGRAHYENGDFAAALQVFERASARTDSAGRPWAPYGLDSKMHRIQVHLGLGEWERAEELGEALLGSAPPVQAAMLSGVLLGLAVRGRAVDTEFLRGKVAAEWDGDGMVSIHAGPELIALAGRAGDAAEAVRVHDDVVEVISRLWSPLFAGRVRLATLTLAEITRAAASASTKRRRAWADQAARVYAAADRVVALQPGQPTPWAPDGMAWIHRLRAEHLRFRAVSGIDAPDAEQLVAAWALAAESFTAWGEVWYEAEAQLIAGEVAAMVGHASAGRHTARAGELVAAHGLRPIEQALATTRRPASSELTQRETQVLGLVAAGRSNGEIGDQLFIATKTVSVHVSNILAKLGVSTRGEAAAVARERGLLDR